MTDPSKTPRTDAVFTCRWQNKGDWKVIREFCESIERELAAARLSLSDSPDAKDAARYRWLRHRTAAGDAGGGQCVMDFPDIYGKRDWLHGSVAQHLDEALDTLIAREPT